MRPAPNTAPLLPSAATVRARREELVVIVSPASARRGMGRVRRALVVAVALLALGAGAAWAAGAFSASEMDIDAGVGCFDRPSLHADVTIFHAAADPVAKCGRLWREGVVDTRRGPSSPHLVACTGDHKPVYVFPGPDGVCERLGLVPLPADYAPLGTAHARAFRALFEIGELRPGGACLPPAVAANQARAKLRAVGATVAVSVQGSGPCAHEYRAVGGRIAVVTSSAAVAEAEQRSVRIGHALSGLIEGLGNGRCVSPAEFRRQAQRRLAAVGLGAVEVRISGRGRCVGGSYGEGGDSKWVEFFAE